MNLSLNDLREKFKKSDNEPIYIQLKEDISNVWETKDFDVFAIDFDLEGDILGVEFY